MIENKELLESAELFKIENLLWGTEKIAKTYGYIGFVPGEGLYIKLVCVEKNPLRIYKKDQDPVYKDSAMEAFFNLKEMIRQMKCSAEIQEEQWNVNLTLPIEILEQVYGKLNLQEGSDFRCNFYKICETKEYEHYAAYRCVESEQPNFHLPESTLLMLVSALAGKDFIMKAYEEAVKERYRFFSFGDAMFITD